MEGLRSDSSPENRSDSSDTKKKDLKKRFFHAPISLPDESVPESHKVPQRPAGLDEALAALAFKRQEKIRAKAESEKLAQKSEVTESETEEKTESAEAEVVSLSDVAEQARFAHAPTSAEARPVRKDTEPEEEDEAYERLTSRDLRPDELNLAEAIDLSRTGEDVILLHGPSAEAETVPEEPVASAHGELQEVSDVVERPEIAEHPESEVQAEERSREASDGAEARPEGVDEGHKNIEEGLVEPDEAITVPTVAAYAEGEAAKAQPNVTPSETAEGSEATEPQHEPEVVMAVGEPAVARLPEELQYHAMIHQPIVGETIVPPIYTAGGERIATKKDVDDAVYYATKAGQQRGLVAGLLAGGLYEHFKHRRREKKAEKRFTKQRRQLEQARNDYKFNLQEQGRRESELKMRLAAVENRPNANAGAVRPEAAIEERRVAAEKQPEKLIIRTAEQIAPENPEQLVVPEGHRIETSAWHSIEVDSRTGRAVEKPVFEYGQEFHRERARESKGAEEPSANVAPLPDTGAELAAATKVPDASTQGGSFAPSTLPSASRQGPPVSPKDKAKAALSSLAKPDSPANSGPLWPWLLSLGVIVLLLIILL